MNYKMEIQYLNTPVASVEAGTFYKAAELLHITQSAVSHRIKLLEECDLDMIEHSLNQDFTGFDRFPVPEDEMLVVAAPLAATWFHLYVDRSC